MSKPKQVVLWKLTDEHGQTYGKTQWGPNVTHTASGNGELCSPGWLHAYTDPLLAVLLNPIHANFSSPQLWRARGLVGKTDHGLKVGCTSLTTIEKVKLPRISTEKRVRFAILCAKKACKDKKRTAWANAWLSGQDRSRKAAAAAAAATAWAAAMAAGEELNLIAIAKQAMRRNA